jgi:cell division protein FtsW
MMPTRVRARRAPPAPAESQPALRKHRPAYLLPVLALVLLAMGLVVIFTIGPGLSVQRNVSENYFVNKQFIAMVLGFAAFFIAGRIPLQFWSKAVWPFVGLAVLGALAVLLFGSEINGATRWVSLGGFSFQAAELIKFAYLLWIAMLLSRPESLLARNETPTLKKILASLLLVGFVVAGLQSDLGSAAVMVCMVGGMLFISGFRLKKIAIVGGIVLAGAVLAIAITPYRRDRLMTFMNPESDCLGSGYQACQALIAVGSGGVFGKGIERSVQAFGYLPFAENDSIFAIYAEKFGFAGTTLFIFLYGLLLATILRVARKAPDQFSRLLVIGVFMWFGSQALINIGAMIGLLPLKGITLPLVSYGGTSLIFVLGALGVVFQVSRYTRRYSAVSSQASDSSYSARPQAIRRGTMSRAGVR